MFLHYIPVYWLHDYTINAEVIMKVVHYVLHSVLIVIMSKIAYGYFRDEPLKAQLVTFIYFTSQGEREMYDFMFNDQIMALYLALTIYLLAIKCSPVWSAIAFSMGLGLKAGVMLILPSYLGSIQYAYGTVTLFKCIFVIFILQAVLALPFVTSGETSVSEYLFYSRFAGNGRGGHGPSKLYEHVASAKHLSILWTWLDDETYYSEWWNNGLKLSILALNIYHFFIR